MEASTEKTMFDILKAIEKELCYSESFPIYEWYCQTHIVSGTDIAPESVVNEVFGE